MISAYQNLFLNLIFGCLLVSTITYFTYLSFPQFKPIRSLGHGTAWIANLGLFIVLAYRWYHHGYFPLSNLYESLLFLSWTLLFVSFLVDHQSGTNLVSTMIIPLVLLIYGFASFTLPFEMQKATPLVPALQSNWLMMHVSLMMLSYGTLMVGSLLAILFLVLVGKKQRQDQPQPQLQSLALREDILSLGNQNSSTSAVSPLLQSLDNLSYRIISLGFPFLTLGIIAGAVWANEAWGSYWSWDPKETWALITWLVFAAYLHARIIKGWEGKGPSLLAAGGFIVVWICYLGVNFLGQGLHSYGWLS